MLYEEPKRNIITTDGVLQWWRSELWWVLADGSPSPNFFFYFFGFFLFLSLPSVGTRQSLTECHTRQRAHDKILASKRVFARVYLGLCRVPETLGKASVSRSAYDIPYDTDVITKTLFSFLLNFTLYPIKCLAHALSIKYR